MGKLRVTQGIFNAVKTLQKGGATNKECADYMHISSATVSMIRNSEDYTEYKNKMVELSASHREKRKMESDANGKGIAQPKNVDQIPTGEGKIVEHRQTVTIQATHYMEQELRKTNELLTQISAKLAFFVDELTK